jgi:hypothetical protein
VRGKRAKLGEGCPKVRLSQDRMPISSPSPSLLSGGKELKKVIRLTVFGKDPIKNCHFKHETATDNPS